MAKRRKRRKPRNQVEDVESGDRSGLGNVLGVAAAVLILGGLLAYMLGIVGVPTAAETCRILQTDGLVERCQPGCDGVWRFEPKKDAGDRYAFEKGCVFHFNEGADYLASQDGCAAQEACMAVWNDRVRTVVVFYERVPPEGEAIESRLKSVW